MNLSTKRGLFVDNCIISPASSTDWQLFVDNWLPDFDMNEQMIIYKDFDTAESYGTSDNPHDNEELLGKGTNEKRVS